MGLDRIPACQSEAVRPSRIERDTREPLVEQIYKGVRCPRLRSKPQVRETLLPAPPDTDREEELTPHLAENRLVEIRAQVINLGGLTDHRSYITLRSARSSR